MRIAVLLFMCLVGQMVFAQEKQITVEDIWRKNTFRIKSVPGFNAMKDGKRYLRIDNQDGRQIVRVYNLETGSEIETLFDNRHSLVPEGLKIDHYSFSEDEQKMLFFSEAEPVYRRSILYKVHVYDRNTRQLELLNEDKVLHASFSPDGMKVAFVKDNNLFYKDLKTGKLKAVTTDGRRNEIINGNADWVYEEEFQFTKAYQWSPDGHFLAYYRFDERQVPEFTMTVYDSLYPTPYKFKYPKAGDPNSVVQIRFYNLGTQQTVNADLGKEKDQYIPRIKWTNDPGSLMIYRLNRHQNHLELLLASPRTGATQVVYEEKNRYYIEIDDNLHFLPDNESFIFSSERSGYNHFYKFNWRRKKLTRLTQGDYDIDQLIGINKDKELLYYTAAEESPLARKLYSVNWNGKNKKELTPEKGTHAITTIEGNRYFLDKHSRLNQPPVFYLRAMDGKIIRTLEDNKELVSKMQEYDLGKLRFKRFPGAEKGVMLHGWMMTPPDFDSTKKYPVLMFQYSGPGSQQVADKFPVADYFWHQMLAQKGYIVITTDGTGTGFRGEEFKKKTYLQLGKLESEDQIAVAKHLGTLPYVDKSRIGIWGWSYGGFMSLTSLMKGNDVFRMAISVAPVTNWRYYDNIYTERYMRTPQENPEGYDNNAPENMVDELKGKLLLVHGTGDDNVHVQNSIMLINELIKANKEYDSEFYPNRKHGISGGNTRYHLYRRMTDFVLNNL